jgi:alpha-tubulin suppressor-like RCC1 family protein
VSGRETSVRMHGRGAAGARLLTGGSGRLVRRLVTAGLVLVLLPVAAAPAGAAGQVAVTRVGVHVSPATVRVGSVLVVSGSVSPKASTPVVVQRLVGKSWHTVGKGKATAGGSFSFAVRAPAKPAGWVLRVTRASSATTKAGVSGLLHVRVVTAVYRVKAAAVTPVVAGSPVVVTGLVTPKATGAVVLQRLVGKTWVTVASAKLTKSSAFAFSTLRPVGRYQLRVVKAFTAKVAGGLSKIVAVSVVAAPVPPAPPAVTTTGLPAGTVGVAYTATLTATGGTPPYVWASSGLPVGLVVTTAGVISGTPTTVGVSTVTLAVRDSAGRTGSAVLTLTVAAAPRASGRLWAWGNNANGELGNNSTTSSDVLVPVSGLTSVYAVAGGQYSGYGLASDGTLWAWGSNAYGQLGNNTTTNSNVPVQVPGLTSVTAIAGGGYGGYALRSDGTVWDWGFNAYGQLGNTSTTNSYVPVQVTGLTSVTAIASGVASGYALRSDGTVWAWGYNSNGELGNNTTTNSDVPVQVAGLTSVTAIAAAGDSGYALSSNGTVWAWGYNNNGELGNSSTTSSDVPVQVAGLTAVTAIAGAGDSGYALRSDGTVWDWGYNNNGQLGNNTTTSSDAPVQVAGLTSVTAIAAGDASGYALRSAGYVSAWGYNGDGELGNSSTTNSSVPVQASGLTGVIGVGSGAGSSSGYAIEAG